MEATNDPFSRVLGSSRGDAKEQKPVYDASQILTIEWVNRALRFLGLDDTSVAEEISFLKIYDLTQAKVQNNPLATKHLALGSLLEKRIVSDANALMLICGPHYLRLKEKWGDVQSTFNKRLANEPNLIREITVSIAHFAYATPGTPRATREEMLAETDKWRDAFVTDLLDIPVPDTNDWDIDEYFDLDLEQF